MASPSGTQAIDRAAALLTAVVHGPEAVSFTELAAASGLAKSTTSRLLMALERHRLVRRDDDGRFWPGELFVRYAWQGTAETDLVAIAQPFLDELGELTGETINLGVVASSGLTARAGGGGAGSVARIGDGRNSDGRNSDGRNSDGRQTAKPDPMVEQIAQVDSRYMIGGTNWVGLAVPLHCSASGKVLLAYGATPIPPGPYQARTDRSVTTKSELEAELASVRERGFAVTDEELEPGLVAVAAPVFAGGRSAIAAVSVSGPTSRLAGRRIKPVAATCADAARRLSARLDGTGGGNRRSGDHPREDRTDGAA